MALFSQSILLIDKKFCLCTVSSGILLYKCYKLRRKTHTLACGWKSLFVKDFLTNFVLFNDKVFVLFSGITGIHKGNSKFSELYDELKNVINAENCGFVGHISRKCFPKKLSGEMSFEKIKELSKSYKKYLFFCNSSNMDRHNCQGCALYKYCHDNNDPDDSLYVNP